MNRPSCDAYFQRFFFEGETKAFDRIGFLCACDYFEKREKKDIRNGGLITGVFSSIQIVILSLIFGFCIRYPSTTTKCGGVLLARCWFDLRRPFQRGLFT